MFSEIQTQGHLRYDDLPLKTKAGVKVQVEFVSNLYDVEGIKVIQCNVRDISERKAAELVTLRYYEQLKVALRNTVHVATIISEMRDPYTAGHERRVAAIANAIGVKLGFNEIELEGLRVAGYLHDIGKVGIPTEILSKPGKISAIEFQLIQGHAQAGYDVLHSMEWPWPVAEVALQHHERIDRSGYPQGLKGDEILLEARIVAVADVVEAMSSHRPYRAALGTDMALTEIELGSGTKYDPKVVEVCLELFREAGFQIPI
jgi:putative nucleotidyltransferase with HDIG domain